MNSSYLVSGIWYLVKKPATQQPACRQARPATSNQGGQVVMILLLVMVVSLAIGLSIVGHSISDISTSTKTESSARALSAAEAGIEKALASSSTTGSLSLGSSVLTNNAAANVSWNELLPAAGVALDYPPVGKESFAQFWLADPSGNNINSYYTKGSFDLYFGIPKDYTGDEDNQPSVEIHIVIKSNPGNGTYDSYSKKYYYDSYSGTANTARTGNGFNKCSGSNAGLSIPVNDGTKRDKFYCKVTVPSTGSYLANSNDFPALVRVRILYSNYSHPIALQPTGSGSGSSLPPQASIYSSTGSSGNTQRQLSLFKQSFVVPYFFDYVLFSASSLQK